MTIIVHNTMVAKTFKLLALCEQWGNEFPNAHNTYVLDGLSNHRRFNCIAYAFDVFDKWIWPADYPYDCPSRPFDQLLIDKFHAELTTNHEYVKGYEKLALYGINSYLVTHLARLHENGWISKLGSRDLVEHPLTDLEGGLYGTYLKTYQIEKKEYKKIAPFVSNFRNNWILDEW